MKYSVKIIIPFYKETLKDWEKAALANNMEKLSNYPVVFLKPEGLNISSYASNPQLSSSASFLRLNVLSSLN